MSSTADLRDVEQAVSKNLAPSNELISDRLRYVLKPTTKRLVLDRSFNKISPSSGNSDVVMNFGDPSKENIFYLSGSNFLDGQTVILRGKLRTSATNNAARPYLPGGAFSLIERITIEALSGQVIEDIDLANVLAMIYIKDPLGTNINQPLHLCT